MSQTPCNLSRAEREECFKRITFDPRGFDPKLGDQAVKLLDGAITSFRLRRAAVMQLLQDDESCIKWSTHEMNWIDKKVEGLKAHKEQQTKRLAQVDKQLANWKAFPDEDDPDCQEVLSNSVMPVLNLSAKATKHASLNKIRCDNRFGASVAEHTKGFSMTETKHRPTKSLEELERLMSQPGTVNSAIGVHPLIASGCRHDAR